MANKKTTHLLKLIIWIVILAIVLISVYLYWEYRKYYPDTDDAYIQANIVFIAPQVTGPISSVYIENNEVVKKGEKLFDIDPAPFEIAVASAQAQLDLTKQKIEALQDAIKSAEALVTQRDSELKEAITNGNRYLKLVNIGQEPKSTRDEVTNKIKVSEAALAASKSELLRAQANLGNLGDKNAEVRAAQAALDQAKLDLQHTHITAPADGKIVNFTARIGTMIQAGTSLLNLVETNQWWISANYKETQLARIRTGQKAIIKVDIYPNYKFQGYVQSISAGSGTAFSILPPENATGNWVKVTQRVPVKVIIKDPPESYPLRVGASATVTIDTTNKSS